MLWMRLSWGDWLVSPYHNQQQKEVKMKKLFDFKFIVDGKLVKTMRVIDSPYLSMVGEVGNPVIEVNSEGFHSHETVEVRIENDRIVNSNDIKAFQPYLQKIAHNIVTNQIHPLSDLSIIQNLAENYSLLSDEYRQTLITKCKFDSLDPARLIILHAYFRSLPHSNLVGEACSFIDFDTKKGVVIFDDFSDPALVNQLIQDLETLGCIVEEYFLGQFSWSCEKAPQFDSVDVPVNQLEFELHKYGGCIINIYLGDSIRLVEDNIDVDQLYKEIIDSCDGKHEFLL
jgi:hypothetical protein